MCVEVGLVLDTLSHWEPFLPFTDFGLQVITQAVKTLTSCLFGINTR